MSQQRYETVFVVIRVDPFLGREPSEDEVSESGPAISARYYDVTVKEVVTTIEEAQREVERLNNLRADKNCRYFWQSTHYFLDGSSHGSSPS